MLRSLRSLPRVRQRAGTGRTGLRQQVRRFVTGRLRWASPSGNLVLAKALFRLARPVRRHDWKGRGFGTRVFAAHTGRWLLLFVLGNFSRCVCRPCRWLQTHVGCAFLLSSFSARLCCFLSFLTASLSTCSLSRPRREFQWISQVSLLEWAVNCSRCQHRHRIQRRGFFSRPPAVRGTQHPSSPRAA